MRYGMVIDLKGCIGCNACTIACKQEHATGPGIFWSRTLVSEKGTYPNARMDYLPLLCMHCENAPCIAVCPTGASHKLENGTVVIDKDKCIGCKKCMHACPYGARSIVTNEIPYYGDKGTTAYEKASKDKHRVGVVEKCDFCTDRVEKGQKPACVLTCPTQSRFFGDLDDPKSNVSKLLRDRDGYQLKPELGTNPSVYYLPHEDS